MRLSHDLLSRACRLLFTLALLVSWSGGATALAQTENSAPSASVARQPTTQDLKAYSIRLERLFDAVEKADRDLPRDTFDPAAVVASVGKEPQKLLEWVRSQTRWVPYRGALRGPSGVLQDRVGNSLDRALLLAELLRGAGLTCRLANAHLPVDEAGQLLLALKAAAVDPPPQGAAGRTSADEWDQSLERQAKEQGADPAQFRRDVAGFTAPVLRIAEDLAQRVQEQTPVLLDALSKAGVKAKSGEAADADRQAIETLQDHWWAQVRGGDGAWTDLDPTWPKSGPDSARPPVKTTVELAKEPGRLPLDSATCHEVTVRVVVEQWMEGRLKQSKVLEHNLRPAELHGTRIVFGHAPMDWPAELDLAAEANPAPKLRDALLRQHGWVPTLMVGDQAVTQAGFSDTGVIDPKPRLDALAKAGKSVGGAAKGAADLLDKLGEPAPEPAARDAGGVLTAEWLEFEFRVPGRQAVTERRDVFDLVGPAARDAAAAGGATAEPKAGEDLRLTRAGALAGASELVVTACRPSAALIQHLFDQNLLASRPAIRKMLDQGAAGDERTALRQVESISPLPVAPYAFAVSRWTWSSVRGAVYVDRPNVVAFHRRFGPAPDNNLSRRTHLDILGSGVGAWPTGDVDPFRSRVEQGVVDANLESLLLASGRAAAQATAVQPSTADLLARSESAGVEWVTLRSDSDSAWSRVRLPPDEAARLKHDLRQGFAAVVPVRPVPLGQGEGVGWWRVDAATGQTVAMTSAGGASAVEYAILLSKIVITAAAAQWAFIGCGGLATGASTGKRLGCAVCAAIVGALTWFAFAGAAATEAGVAATGLAGALGGTGGVAGASLAGIGCNAISGLAS